MRNNGNFDIPADLLARYVKGQSTVKEIALQLGVSHDTILRRFHALGVDTSLGRYQIRRLAHAIEEGQNLPAGTAGLAVASLYRSGLSTYEVADRLGCARQRAWRLLQREGVPLRPRWYRSVFMTPDGRPRSMLRFSARLRELRHARGWTQVYLGKLCGVNYKTIAHWEREKQGPSWRALRRLAKALNVTLVDLAVTWPPV